MLQEICLTSLQTSLVAKLFKLKHLILYILYIYILLDIFYQENGVPQNSTISITLFLISIKDISEDIINPYTPLLYADDFTIVCCSTHIHSIQQVLQISTNRLMFMFKSSSFQLVPEKIIPYYLIKKRKEIILISMLEITPSKINLQSKILALFLIQKLYGSHIFKT